MLLTWSLCFIFANLIQFESFDHFLTDSAHLDFFLTLVEGRFPSMAVTFPSWIFGFISKPSIRNSLNSRINFLVHCSRTPSFVVLHARAGWASSIHRDVSWRLYVSRTNLIWLISAILRWFLRPIGSFAPFSMGFFRNDCFQIIVNGVFLSLAFSLGMSRFSWPAPIIWRPGTLPRVLFWAHISKGW